MKTWSTFALWTGVIIVVFALGHATGRILQHVSNGYHYEIIDEASVPFGSRELVLIHATESTGWPILEPETIIVTLDGVTIYKATRVFQESYPFVDKVEVNGDEIVWTDRVNEYRLRVNRSESFDGRFAMVQVATAACCLQSPR